MKVVRSGELRKQMIALNRNDRAVLDGRFAGTNAAPEEAVRDHAVL